MSTTIISTVGGTDSNSYLDSVAELQEYIDALRPMKFFGVDFTGYDALGSGSDETKKRLMVQAGEALDALATVGVSATELQRMAWPKVNTGLKKTNNVIPDALKMAQAAFVCELCRPATAAEQAERDGVLTETIDKRSTTYARGNKTRTTGGIAPLSVQAILKQSKLLGGGVQMVNMPRA